MPAGTYQKSCRIILVVAVVGSGRTTRGNDLLMQIFRTSLQIQRFNRFAKMHGPD